MQTTHQVKQGTDEWHALRVGKVTASNASVLLMRGKHAATGTFGVHSDGSSGFWAERGHILEEEAIEIYNDVYGVQVERPGFITNDDYPDCGYSPDGMLPDRAVEVKCFMEQNHLSRMVDVPNEIVCQVQFGLMISELPECDLIFYNPDITDSSLCFKVVRIYRDERLISRFRKALGLEEL